MTNDSMIPSSHHFASYPVEANAEYWRSFGFLASTDFDCAMETVGGLRIRHKESHFVIDPFVPYIWIHIWHIYNDLI
jgi:hypothetical protein